MIDNQPVAICDACHHVENSDDSGIFRNGYFLVIHEMSSDRELEAVACKETHIGRAARAILEQDRHRQALATAPRAADHTDSDNFVLVQAKAQ